MNRFASSIAISAVLVAATFSNQALAGSDEKPAQMPAFTDNMTFDAVFGVFLDAKSRNAIGMGDTGIQANLRDAKAPHVADAASLAAPLSLAAVGKPTTKSSAWSCEYPARLFATC